MKIWLEPPRLRIGPETEKEHRHATWLELFYDLVFVVAISQVAHYLHEHVTWSGFFSFVFLFVPIWWAWIGSTFYANRFDTDDIGNRLLTGLQMLAIAALAVNVHEGLAESSTGFALAYAVSRFILVFQYLRVIKHIPQARKFATHHTIGFAVAAFLWFISAFIPITLRFIFWGLGLAIDFATPITAKRHQTNLLPHPEHLPERFGLFTIIVLGEAIIAVVNGVSEKHWDIGSAISAVFGFIIAFGLWWVYFENVAGSALRNAGKQGKLGIFQVWLFGHLPLVIGLTATGVGVQGVVLSDASLALPTPERWLICGAVALCLFGLCILHRTGLIFPCKVRARYRLGAAVVLLVIAAAGVKFNSVIIIGSVALVVVFQVLQDLYQSGQFSS
ncbi:low temperature requirement protein A [Mastigocoleus testarum]|uniref:Low temperature requirement protein A n=1 Tax=Mastigocoleus testarum BC008 TaxID=371196 RepID=A0A0V7ZNX8_9CYAN|nr:low temperature requirement protein A [Mastigocoleus testarum]KST66275.1 low temperature requirement protein A [Mastigocoleus testarum BC008]